MSHKTDQAQSKMLMTSEAGLSGHPDKLADSIGDAILDAYLTEDSRARVGCQVMVANGLVVIGGQITSNASIDLRQVVRDVIANVGYEIQTEGLCSESDLLIRIDPQSHEIATDVDKGGAGDSAIVIGYACRDTAEFMPLPPKCAHTIAAHIDLARRSGRAQWLRPDGKIQVTASYENGVADHVRAVIASVEHRADTDPATMEHFLRSVIKESIPARFVMADTQLLSRSNVGFSIGGPKADCGLSGRKVIADTYGGVARHGGGGLSGKDPSKIDRCGMYAARYIAKNLVAAGLADRCEVQLAYMIGHSEPIAISAECIGGHGIRQELIIEIIRRVFPLSPPAIVDELRLRRPIYRHVGLYGHFGHEGSDFTWEECDRVADIHRFI